MRPRRAGRGSAAAGQGDAGDGIGVDEASGSELSAGECQGVAVGLAVVIGSNGEGLLVHRQGAVGVGDAVVGQARSCGWNERTSILPCMVECNPWRPGGIPELAGKKHGVRVQAL